jgi:hypothetical protein
MKILDNGKYKVKYQYRIANIKHDKECGVAMNVEIWIHKHHLQILK